MCRPEEHRHQTRPHSPIFSAPGFEDHLRCESVLAGEKATTISLAEENECDRIGHVVYRDRAETVQKRTPTNEERLRIARVNADKRESGWLGGGGKGLLDELSSLAGHS